MRADRLISLLLLLQVHGRLTAREMAQRVEVSERTIHRDMEALSGAGVPVIAERGTGGGWSLLAGYRTSLTGLKIPEARALLLGQPSHLLGDLGLDQAAQAAGIKVLASLPTVLRNDAEYTRQRLHFDGAGWHDAPEAVPYLLALQDVLWQQRQARIVYQRADGTPVERDIDPLGLVAKGSIWYVVATCTGDLRTYRVGRIQHLELLDLPSQRPDDFDLAAYWAQSAREFKARLPSFPATLLVADSVVPAMQRGWRYVRFIQAVSATPGWAQVDVEFEEEHNACEYILSFGARIEVLLPTSLRHLVLEAAQGILTRYATARTAPH